MISTLDTRHSPLIGIFGGTFDPVHYGHLRPARELAAALQLKRVHVMPAAVPPHRSQPVASAAQRLRMVQLALVDDNCLLADDRELRRSGPSYTVETLLEFRQQFAGHALVLMIGADSFGSLPQWHRWQELFELAHIGVMARPGWTASWPEWAAPRRARSPEELKQQAAGRIWLQPVAQQDISATSVREALARGDAAVRPWLPPAVFDYIEQQHLYREQ